jgi:Zn-dependent protease with chaperone function
VALLVGFYVLGFGAVIVFAVLDLVSVKLIGPLGTGGIFLLLVAVQATLFALTTMFYGVTVSTRFSAADFPGVPVTPEDEPELWARVRRLARAMGTRGPQRILISTEADAAVWEYGPLLGLFPGKRHLVIGAPLLLALSTAQLDAIIAHELGHFGNSDTRLGPLVNRGRMGILTALRVADRSVPIGRSGTARRFEPRGWWYVVLALRCYAHLFFSLTQATSRAQEFGADRAGARLVGRESIVSALAELPVIAVAYRLYLENYVYCGLPYGLVPEPDQVIGGFGSLIADPGRRAEFDLVRRQLAAGGTGGRRFDSHPPLHERLAALRALPDDGRDSDEPSGQPAVEMLRHRQTILTALGRKKLGDEASGKTALDWKSLTDAVLFHNMDRVATPLVNAVAAVTGATVPTPESLLDAIGAGRLSEILDRLNSSSDATAAAPSQRLRAWMLVVLAERGHVRWSHSWSGFAELDAPPGLSEALSAAVAAVLANQPDCGPLRAILHGSGFR